MTTLAEDVTSSRELMRRAIIGGLPACWTDLWLEIKVQSDLVFRFMRVFDVVSTRGLAIPRRAIATLQ